MPFSLFLIYLENSFDRGTSIVDVTSIPIHVESRVKYTSYGVHSFFFCILKFRKYSFGP
jgi:hypothetical protein